MTGEEFLCLSKESSEQEKNQKQASGQPSSQKRFVYGLKGIADLFGCSIPTAQRIKNSGAIDKAITQMGRKIIVDADCALELAGKKSRI